MRLGCGVDRSSSGVRHDVADSLEGTGILRLDVIIVMAIVAQHTYPIEDTNLEFVIQRVADGGWLRCLKVRRVNFK